MPSTGKVLSLAAALSTAQAAYQGFNYGATFTDGTIKQESDFEAEFKAAQSLAGTDGAFTSARLFTMVVSICCKLRITS
jgi:glucan endo-1,3-beta-D-glucosidase